MLERVWRAPLVAIGLLLTVPPLAGAAEAAISGNWLTDDGKGVIEVGPCVDGVCGRIVGQSLEPGEPPARDAHGEPECGETIIRMTRNEDDVWYGTITDPSDGKVYRSTLRLDGSGHLLLRGYILLPALGQTREWSRFDGKLGADCHIERQNTGTH